MQDLMNVEPEEARKPKGRRNWALWGAIAVLAVGNTVAVWEIRHTRNEIDGWRKSTAADIGKLSEQAQSLNARADTHEVMLRSDLKQATEMAQSAATKASKAAEKKAEQMVTRLAAEYDQQRAQITDELGQVKNAAQETANQVSRMHTDVGAVQGEVQRTRSDLESTRTELKSMKGDLGVQSGLIATNAEQLAELRRLGERDYFEFSIPRDGKSYKVSNVVLKLRKTRMKDGRFTLNVVADDVEVQKKDRTVNEPIQFYMSNARQPYELVVNKVLKDRIVGYLAVPKVLAAAR